MIFSIDVGAEYMNFLNSGHDFFVFYEMDLRYIFSRRKTLKIF